MHILKLLRDKILVRYKLVYILLDLHSFVFFISASRDPHINKFNNYFTMETTQVSKRKKEKTLNYYKPSIPASTNKFTFNAIHTNRRN